MTIFLIIIFIIIIICLFVYSNKGKSKSNEGFGDFFDTYKTFGDAQNTTFRDVEGKAIFINDKLGLQFLNEAIQQPELYLPKSLDRKYEKYFQTNPENMYGKDDSLCFQAKHPRDLPARNPNSRVNCGWYFVQDPSIDSVGAIGRNSGPIIEKDLPPNGEWLWDLALAARKEDIKFCKKYKMCESLLIDEVKSKCAFCPSQGYAVPINSDGTIKYPDSADGYCDRDIIHNPDNCNKQPEPPPITSSDGKSCGSLGRPSADNSIRLYNKEECDKLDGNLSSDGQCSAKTGGSYSFDCRSLNEPVSMIPTPKSLCSPDATGKLSNECIQTTAIGIGFSKTGGLLKIHAQTGQLSKKETNQMSVAVFDSDLDNAYGFNFHYLLFENAPTNYLTTSSSFVGTPVSLPTLLKRLNSIFLGMKNSSKKVSAYSKWFVSGEGLPDLCAKKDDDKGPFEVQCLQQAFRMAGCQGSGEAYPSDSKLYTGKKWSAVNLEFRNLYDSMKSGDSDMQDNSVKKCLGINYFREVDTDYTKAVGQDVDPKFDSNIACYSNGEPASFCRAKCDNDPTCSMYVVVAPNTWWGDKSGCCVKNAKTRTLIPRNGITAYLKNSYTNFLDQIKSIPGLVAWYDGADPSGIGNAREGELVKTWADKSGNNNHMISQIPGQFTSNGIRFLKSWYRSTKPISAFPIDVYCVVKLNELNRPNDIIGYGQIASDNFNSLTFGEFKPGLWHNGSSYFQRTPNAASSSAETSTTFLLMQWSIANNNFYINRNGSNIMRSTAYTWNPGNPYLTIGNRVAWAATGNELTGTVSEVIVFNNQLGSDNKKKVEDYLNDKWNIGKPCDMNKSRMYGPWINNNDAPVQKIAEVNGKKIYMTDDDNYTKMVDEEGNGRYYTGKISSFDPNKYNSYNSAGIGNYNLRCKK